MSARRGRRRPPAPDPSIVEPQLRVGIPVSAPDPTPEIPRHARNAIAGSFRLFEDSADLIGQIGRHVLVGVEREDPVVRREVRRAVLLRSIPGPVEDLHSRRVPPRDVHGSIGAAGIDDDDFVSPGHRRKGELDVVRFVQGDDRNGQLHGWECSSKEGRGARRCLRKRCAARTFGRVL